MSEFPKEKGELPSTPNRGEGTAETSFTEGGIPETPTPENILSEEDQKKELEKAEKDKTKMGAYKSKRSLGQKRTN